MLIVLMSFGIMGCTSPEPSKKLLSSMGYTNKGMIMKKEKLNKNKVEETPKCLHEYCRKCHGKGIDKNGNACVHMLVCNCPKCNNEM